MAEWGKLYGSLHGSPEWRAATKTARALWATALSWCIDQEGQDGDIPAHMLRTLDGTVTEVECLVRVGLWEVVDGGWHFHNYERRQRTKERIRADREADAERQRRARSRRESRRDTPVTPGMSHASRVEESREEKRTTTTTDSSSPATPATPPGQHVRDGLFDIFWAAYPRKVGKATARRAFDAAIRRAGRPTLVIEGARRLATDPNLPEREFIPHPPTWLNRDGWEDEPLPARTNGRPPERPRPGAGVWSQVVGGEPQ